MGQILVYSASEKLGLASMHTADSGLRLGLVGAMGSVVFAGLQVAQCSDP